jgi:hypothetical protein
MDMQMMFEPIGNFGDFCWGNFEEINVWKMWVHPKLWELNDFGENISEFKNPKLYSMIF